MTCKAVNVCLRPMIEICNFSNSRTYSLNEIKKKMSLFCYNHSDMDIVLIIIPDYLKKLYGN